MSLPLVTRFGADPLLARELATKNYVDTNIVGNTFARVVKKVTQTIDTNDILVNDDELFVALNANKNYGFLLFMPHISPVAADIKYDFSIPAGASGRRTDVRFDSGTSFITPLITVAKSVATGGTASSLQVMGNVIMAGTAGNFQFQWTQNVSNAGDTSVLAGAFFIVWEELP